MYVVKGLTEGPNGYILTLPATGSELTSFWAQAQIPIPYNYKPPIFCKD